MLNISLWDWESELQREMRSVVKELPVAESWWKTHVILFYTALYGIGSVDFRG